MKDASDQTIRFLASTFLRTTFCLFSAPVPQVTTYCAECERWRTLIQNNISDIDAVNSAGDTALHIASRNGKTTMALLLLEAGANAQLTNYAGETPLKMAAECADACEPACAAAAFLSPLTRLISRL